MLNVTRLLCGTATPGDGLRYGEGVPGGSNGVPPQRQVHHRPVVVWNVTRRCNLRCIHCYMAATQHAAPDELTYEEAVDVVGDLALFGAPVILFSGGEPLMREDVFDLMDTAHRLRVQPVLSTNGTLLTDDAVTLLRRAGVRRVGISLDGLENINDRFRGVQGAFRDGVEGIRRCRDAGIRVSLRFTLTRYNAHELDGIFSLVEQEQIPRLCIYHLAYAGRGRKLLPQDLDHQERRAAVSSIFQHTVELHRRGVPLEALTVDNHADGPYLLLWAESHLPERVPEIRQLLQVNGGNAAGKGIGCIDERGFVHPDQFWRSQKLGNVREHPFSQIWEGDSAPLLKRLRNRGAYLPETCRNCRFVALCNGNLRARAEAATGNPWGMDPACYLADGERSDTPKVAL